MNKRTVVATILCGAVLTSIPAVSWAETASETLYNVSANEISPYLLLIENIECTLSISNETATARCIVSGDIETATAAKLVAELQVKNGSSWRTVTTWSEESASYKAELKETRTVISGETYRVKATVTVWEGSLSETQTVYSNEQTV